MRQVVVLNADGEAALILAGADEKARALLTLEKDEPLLSFIGPYGTKLAHLVVAKGEAGLIFSDQNGKPRVVLGTIGGTPAIAIVDANGRARFKKP